MDPYERIAEYYDLEHRDFAEDIDFYLDVIQEGPVLEVGAGTGRVLGPLAQAGHDVWGIEPSEAMLAVARKKLQGLQNAHLVPGRIENFRSDKRFAAVLWPLNMLGHLLTTEAQMTGLGAARMAMRDGALLVVDLSNPYTLADREATGDVRCRFTSIEDSGSVLGFSAAWDDQTEQIIDLELWYDDTRNSSEVRRTSTRLELRYLYRNELDVLLRSAGFTPLEFYGTYSRDEYSARSPNLIALAGAG